MSPSMPIRAEGDSFTISIPGIAIVMLEAAPCNRVGSWEEDIFIPSAIAECMAKGGSCIIRHSTTPIIMRKNRPTDMKRLFSFQISPQIKKVPPLWEDSSLPSPCHEARYFMSEPLILPLTGLKCDGCVRSLTRALEASPAIETATVTLDPPQAHIIFSGSPLSREECAALIQQAGFGSP